MSANTIPSTSPFCDGYIRTAGRFNGQPVYYHPGLDDLAYEELQDARLVAVPNDAALLLREQLNLPLHLETKGSFVSLLPYEEEGAPRRGRVLYSNNVGVCLRVATIGDAIQRPPLTEFRPWPMVIALNAETPTVQEAETLNARCA